MIDKMTILHLELPSITILDVPAHHLILEFSPSDTVGKWVAAGEDLETLFQLPTISPAFRDKKPMKGLTNLSIHVLPLFKSLTFPRRANVSATYLGNPVFFPLEIYEIKHHKMREGAKFIITFDKHQTPFLLHGTKKGRLEKDDLVILENTRIVIL